MTPWTKKNFKQILPEETVTKLFRFTEQSMPCEENKKSYTHEKNSSQICKRGVNEYSLIWKREVNLTLTSALTG